MFKKTYACNFSCKCCQHYKNEGILNFWNMCTLNWVEKQFWNSAKSLNVLVFIIISHNMETDFLPGPSSATYLSQWTHNLIILYLQGINVSVKNVLYT
jgi:hypothetical protein